MSKATHYFPDGQNGLIVESSRGKPIKIDPDEYEKAIKGISSGATVRFRQGTWNPSFYVQIVKDQERMAEERKKKREIEDWNKEVADGYHGPEAVKREYKGMPALEDILAGVPGVKELPPPSSSKQLIP